MMMTSIESSSMFAGPSANKADMEQRLQERFAQDFGEEALASVQNTDGSINRKALDSFMTSQGIEKPSGPPPGGPPGGPFGGNSGKVNADALLEMLASDFGDEAIAEVTDEDGGLNFEKLKSFLEEKMEGTRMRPPPPPPPSTAEDEETLLEKILADFGEAAADEVTNDDGSINPEQLKSFLDEKVATGELPAPPTPHSETSQKGYSASLNLADALKDSTANQSGSQSQSNLLEMLVNSDGSSKSSLFSSYA